MHRWLQPDSRGLTNLRVESMLALKEPPHRPHRAHHVTPWHRALTKIMYVTTIQRGSPLCRGEGGSLGPRKRLGPPSRPTSRPARNGKAD
eukprot:scaffold532433_cov45-Prasinocladus_malaysianus.AAC.4